MPPFGRNVFKISKLVTITNSNILSPSSSIIIRVPRAHSPVGVNSVLFARGFSVSCTLQTDNVLVNVENGVRKIVINRPEKKNALRYDMVEKIGNALWESNSDNETKLVTLTGSGDYFSSGNDISNWDTSNQNLSEMIERGRQSYLKSMLFGLIECRKPIIALVNGPAIGVGATLLAHCDQILSSDKAFFSTPFASIGILPEFCSSYLFPKIMGSFKANDMLLFGHKLPPVEAQACGLITRVFPADSFAASTKKLIEEYAQLPLEPLMKAKELIRAPDREKVKQVASYEFDQGFTLFNSPYFRSNVEKFFSKQPKKL